MRSDGNGVISQIRVSGEDQSGKKGLPAGFQDVPRRPSSREASSRSLSLRYKALLSRPASG